MPAAFLQPLDQAGANQFTAIHARSALAILGPQMQTPRLLIREMAGNSVDDAIRPRIDRNSRRFERVWQRLPRKGQMQAFELCV